MGFRKVRMIPEAMQNKFIILISSFFITLTATWAQKYTITESNPESISDNQIYHKHEWLRVKDLGSSEKKILRLDSRQNKLRVVRAKFLFSVDIPIEKFNRDYFTRADVLSGLSGMNFQRVNETVFQVYHKVLGISVNSQAQELFDLDYDLYQSTFNYVETKDESFLTHQRSFNFSRTLYTADIITQISESQGRTVFKINSYAVLTKGGGRFPAYLAVKSFVVKSMKEQILKNPAVHYKFLRN